MCRSDFTLRQVLEKCQEETKRTGTVFIDVEGAFDSVRMWQALE